jgi:hypothetical protein
MTIEMSPPTDDLATCGGFVASHTTASSVSIYCLPKYAPGWSAWSQAAYPTVHLHSDGG